MNKSKKIQVIEIQGLPHTLTQTDGKTFRLFARQTKVIDEKLVSAEFYAEQKMKNILLTPVVESEETKHTKGGNK